MTDVVLHVDNVGKAYRKFPGALSRIRSWFGFPGGMTQEAWVLRHVGFNVGRGEAIGIVGQNGAGKSTLLKLLTGITRPTEGSISINGRVAAILELGMGFNPELTARDNVRHSAGLMGFDASQIEDAMPGIEEFAEIGEYFDQAMRTYSSGMQMRVAFSVATAFRPDVLIIDEALSVGDAYFQHKSFERIREFQRSGTTLLLVSHDRTAVQALCGRALLLEQGRLIKDGAPEEVMDYYNALIAERENSTVSMSARRDGRVQTLSGTGEARVSEIGLFSMAGEPVDFVNVGQELELRVRCIAHASIPRLVLGYMIKDRLGQAIYGTNTHYTEQPLLDVAEGSELQFRIFFRANLGAGSYSVSTALVSTETHLVNNYEWRDLALVFTVANQDKPTFVGSAWLPAVFEISRQ